MGRRAQPKDSIMALNAVSPLTEQNSKEMDRKTKHQLAALLRPGWILESLLFISWQPALAHQVVRRLGDE